MLNNPPDLSTVGGFLMAIADYQYNKIGMRSPFIFSDIECDRLERV
jgi:hypothetical protein